MAFHPCRMERLFSGIRKSIKVSFSDLKNDVSYDFYKGGQYGSF